MVMAASEDFLAGGNYDSTIWQSKRFGNFDKLIAQDYFQTYLTQRESTRGDLLLVQNYVGQEYYQR